MAATTDWLDISDRWYFAAEESKAAGLTIRQGEGGYNQVRVEGDLAAFQAFRENVAKSFAHRGADKASRTRALQRIDFQIECLKG